MNTLFSMALRLAAVCILALGGFATFRRLWDAVGPWAGRDDRPSTFAERAAYYVQINLSDALTYAGIAVLGACGCWLIASLLSTTGGSSQRRDIPLEWLTGVAFVASVGLAASGLLRQNFSYLLGFGTISVLGLGGVLALVRVRRLVDGVPVEGAHR